MSPNLDHKIQKAKKWGERGREGASFQKNLRLPIPVCASLSSAGERVSE